MLKMRYTAFIIALFVTSAIVWKIHDAPIHAAPPRVVISVDQTTKTLAAQYVASIDVARVFGRSSGCAEASPVLIGQIANESIKVGLDPRILAATIAIESNCNPWATSSKGAIGLTQVVAATWK